MTGTTFTTLDAIERQALACEQGGSPLYGSLLRGLATDHAAGGLTAQMLEGVSARPVHDAVALRYLAVAHRLALAGAAPALASAYPSCGGEWTGDDLTGAFLTVVARHRDEFARGLQRPVQTNEVGRAAALVAGLSLVAMRHGAALRTWEVGASAGLLSRWPSFWYDTGETVTGDRRSPVAFGPAHFQPGPLPRLVDGLQAVERRACDSSPLDVTSAEDRLTMLSFLWPDQTTRFERLRAALEVAAADPVPVERADAGEWVPELLRRPAPTDLATVVFHTIVWQYMATSTRDIVRQALVDAGRRATTARPLCWLRMEPVTVEHADLRLTTWTGGGDGTEEVLAEVGYHGTNLRWLSVS